MTDFAEFDWERYRERRGLGYRCPACLQKWWHPQGLRRHMAVLHHRCRFCTKAYIRVDRHEKLAHTNEYAIEAGACLEKRCSDPTHTGPHVDVVIRVRRWHPGWWLFVLRTWLGRGPA